MELLPRSVIKRFSDPEDYFRELRVYQAGLPLVPRLLRCGERQWIEMERIAGLPYLDQAFGPRDAAQLAATLAQFHGAWFSEDICLCHWDNQPKNILRAGEAFHFIDFSDSRLAPPEADLSHLFLFWAAEFPLEAVKTLCEAFLEAYAKIITLDPQRWETALKQSLERFSNRRKLHLRQEQHRGREEFDANLALLSKLLS